MRNIAADRLAVVVSFDYDIRAKLGPLLLFISGGMILVWADDYSLSESSLAFILGAALILGLISIELVTTSVVRQRLPRTPSGHVRRLLTVIVFFLAVRWLLAGFTLETQWRSVVAWFVSWALIYAAMVWAVRATSVSDPRASGVQ